MKEDYKFGRKNSWRRWAWNGITIKLKSTPSRPRPKDALVVYLPGPQNLDKDEAMRRRFRPNNLIAIERELKVVDALRAQGQLCIHDSFCESVNAILSKRKVDVIFGDFVCGLEQSVMVQILNWTSMAGSRNAVFAFNFLRGRDSSSNWFREQMQLSSNTARDSKHRGLQLFFFLMAETALRIKINELPKNESEKVICSEFWNICRPSFGSYMSGNQMFDSVIFSSFFFCESNWNIPNDTSFIGGRVSIADGSVRAQAPVFAHRTMRLKAA